MIQTTNFSHGTSDLSSIKEFRRRTKRQGKVILDNFADNGVLIVRLKKLERKRQLSNSEKQELQKLQQKSRNIIDQINKILSDSKYTASDVLLNGYPELTKGERRYWLGIEEKRPEKQEVKKSETKSVTKSSSSSGSLDFNIDDEFLDDLEAEINKTLAITEQKTIQIENKLESAEYNKNQTPIINPDAQLPDKVDIAKDIIDKEIKPIFSAIWEEAGGSVFGLIKGFLKILSLPYAMFAADYIIDDMEFLGALIKEGKPVTELIKLCKDSAAELKSPVHKFLRKYLTPLLGRLATLKGSAKFIQALGMLAKLFKVGFYIQLGAHLLECLMKVMFKSAYSTGKEFLNNLVVQLKTCTSVLGNKKEFKYLNFDVKDVNFTTIGFQPFMHNTDYVPIARYYAQDNPDKEEGLLFLSVYDPNLYINATAQTAVGAVAGAVRPAIGGHIRNIANLTTGRNSSISAHDYQSSLVEYRESLLELGIPQKKLGEDQYKLIQLHLVPYDRRTLSTAISEKQDQSIVLLEAVNPNANDFIELFKSIAATGKIPDKPIGSNLSYIGISKVSNNATYYLDYIFQVNSFAWVRDKEVYQVSWMRTIRNAVENAGSLVLVRAIDANVRLIKYFFQNEKDDDFVLSGSWDPVELFFSTFSTETRKGLSESWKPCIDLVKSTYFKGDTSK